MRRVKGVTVAEGSMSFRRIEQLFASSTGSSIHQIKMQSGAGIVATSFAGSEIQKRSYPNSFGGQHMLAGLRADRIARPGRQRAAHRRRVRRAAFRRAVSRGPADHHPRQLAARLADSRIHRPSHRARPRPRHGSEFRGHELSHHRKAAQTEIRLRHRQRRRRRAPRARPRPRHVRLRRRRRSRAVHADHHQRPFHRLSEQPRNRVLHRRKALRRHDALRKLESPAR